MEDPVAQAILGRLGEMLSEESRRRLPAAEPPATEPSEPVKAPEKPPAQPNKALAIASIIEKAYSMPGVPERTRKRCAKYAIAEAYDAEEAKKYFRTSKKKVAVQPTPAAVAVTPPAPAPTPAASIPSTSEPPKISIDGDLRKLMAVAPPQDAPAQ